MSELETASSLNTFINYLLEKGISIEYAEINKWKKYTMESPNFPKEYVFRREKKWVADTVDGVGEKGN